jgi:hypothetical protein
MDPGYNHNDELASFVNYLTQKYFKHSRAIALTKHNRKFNIENKV